MLRDVDVRAPSGVSGIAGALQCLKASSLSSHWHRRRASVVGSALSNGLYHFVSECKKYCRSTGKLH